MTKLKSCSFCNKNFKGKPHRKYCSQDCYKAYRESKIIYKNCCECGKTITRPPKHFERVEKHFCSRKCRNIHMTGENHHAFIEKGNCKTCGKELMRTGVEYCSEKCVKRKGVLRQKRFVVNCDNCSKTMRRLKTHINKTNFCSIDCKNDFHSKIMKGENNPRFKDGIWKNHRRVKRSYSGFTLKLKKQIRKRDGNKCQVCGIEKEEHGMNMHVHHIDYIKENNSPSNLICVCRYCHGTIHGDEKKWQEILLKKLSL